MVHSAADTVQAYAVDDSTGALTAAGAALAVGADTRAVLVDPTGQFLYAASGGEDLIYRFTITPSTGALSFDGTVMVSGIGAGAMVMLRAQT